MRGYTQKYNSYIQPNWGHLKFSDFKASMFDEWASESLLSGKSINETQNVLSQIFKRAYFDGVIELTWSTGLKDIKKKPLNQSPLTNLRYKEYSKLYSPPIKSFTNLHFTQGCALVS